MVAIDVLYLVDRLEALLTKGWRVPMTSKTMVDEDEFLDIVDQMRIAFPEEIKQAKKIVQDRERILAQTQEESTRVLTMAKEDAARLVNEHTLVKTARQQAAQIEQQANTVAESRQQDANEYVSQILGDLQKQLDQFAQQIATIQSQVYNGLSVIQGDQNTPADPETHGQNS
jgi:hypothetical protein